MTDPGTRSPEPQEEPRAIAEPSEPSIGGMNCDRCGASMYEHGCKVTCGNCGHRLDCSDLNIYFE